MSKSASRRSFFIDFMMRATGAFLLLTGTTLVSACGGIEDTTTDAQVYGGDAAYGGPPGKDAGPVYPDAAYGGPPEADAGSKDAAPPVYPDAAYGGPWGMDGGI